MNRLFLALVAALGFALPILVIGCATAKVAQKPVERPVNTVEAVPTAVPAPQPTPQPVETQVVAHRDSLPRYIRHKVVKGNTLWGVSTTYHKTGFLWPMLAEQNGIPDPDLIQVGETVRVAPPSRVKTYPKAVVDRWKQTAYDAHP